MSTSSGSEIEQSDSANISQAPPEVPLAALPLVADHQNTVVSSLPDGSDSASGSSSTIISTSDTGDSLDPSEALFSTNGSDTIPGSVRLQHFQVRRKIGSGGMGKVFLAEDLTLRRPVALKVLNPGAVSDSSLLARFQNEARSAALLRHDNIAQVYFTGESHGVHFIACEYIAGKTIRELIDEHKTLPVDLVVNYAVQATLALNHMHAAGVIHRDIKPSNIIVSNEGRVKIVDLGLARRDSPDSVCDITVAGSTLGTFDYLAPEQARDPREADVRSDIYSLGCTLYHMLTGQPPYPEGTALQKLLDHQGKQAPDPAHINNRVPGEIADIVLTMMKTDPADRYQTPAELLSELIEVATDMGLQGVPADGVVWRPVNEPAIRQLSGAMVLLAGVIIFCITAITLHWVRLEQPAFPMTVLDEAPGMPVDNPEGGPDPNEPTTSDSPTDKDPDGSADSEEMVPVPKSDRPFIVHTADGEQKAYETLSKALSAPVEAIGIELEFDGLPLLPITNLPRLQHQNVHLYAAKGFHPVLELDGITNGPATTSLFTLTSSNLTLEGIALRLIPDINTTDSIWSIFDCSGSTHLELLHCSIEIADGASVEICRLKESTSDRDTQHVTNVHLSNVIVRGAADMFHVEAQTTGTIRLENCGIGIDGFFVNNTGSVAMDGPGRLNIELEHVTCVLGAPLIRIAENDSPTARRMISSIQVTSLASVFCSLAENGTLIESQGTGILDELTELLSWSGDTNLYSAFDTFWTLRVPKADPGQLDYNWDEWTTYWTSPARATGNREENGIVFDWIDAIWKTQSGEASNLSQLKPDWLELDPRRFYGGTLELPRLPQYLDREFPGVEARRLPDFPDSTPPSPDDSPE